MATIVQNPDFGTGVGQALGSGLSQAFQLLAQKKLKEMSRQESARGLQALGYSPEQALQLANLDPAILREAIKQRGKEAETSRFGEALSLLAGGSAPQPEQQLLQVLQQPSVQEQQLQPQQQFEQPAQPNIKDLLSAAGVYPQAPKPTPLIVPSKPETIKPALAALSPTAQEMKQALPELKTITPSDVARIAKQTKLTAQQYKDLNQIAQDNRKTQIAERKQQILEGKELRRAEREAELAGLEKHKFSKPEIKVAREAANSSKKILHDLERFEELEKEGKLDTPGYIEFLKRTGLDIPALQNPGSEEFAKIAANFIGGAQKAVGGRVSNFELEQFLKTIPNLSQSPDGRKRVIANLKRINRANVEYYNTVKEVLKENKDIPPLDLFEKVDDRIDKKLDKISEQFKKDLARPVPAGQNRLITALQAGAGSALKNVPRALAQGAIGAATGAGLGGPVGALGGGIAGGLAGLGGYGVGDVLKGLLG